MSNYQGMTVNERLSAANQLEIFDSAIRSRDKQGAIAILSKLELSVEQATETVEAVLENPEYYGYEI